VMPRKSAHKHWPGVTLVLCEVSFGCLADVLGYSAWLLPWSNADELCMLLCCSSTFGITPNPATDGQPVIILKTRRSLRAVHFHPHGAPLLLTAEVP